MKSVRRKTMKGISRLFFSDMENSVKSQSQQYISKVMNGMLNYIILVYAPINVPLSFSLSIF